MKELIKVEKSDEQSLRLFFDSGERRIFNIKSILNSVLSQALIKRWELMFNSGNFFNVEIDSGDLVWPGWCELFSEDIDKFTYKEN